MVKRVTSNARLKSPRPTTMDAYLASLPPGQRSALEKLRQDIKAAAPLAEEGFSYGLPAFRLDGRPLAGFAAAAHHCSLYPMSANVIRLHADDLARYETSKAPSALPRKSRCRRHSFEKS